MENKQNQNKQNKKSKTQYKYSSLLKEEIPLKYYSLLKEDYFKINNFGSNIKKTET